MEYKKNDQVTVTIQDIGSGGEGIGRVNGFTLFIKDAVAGDIVEARITKCTKNYAYGRLEKVITPSPFRVEPRCRLHRQCGGCQLQTLSYDKQLEFKQKKIRDDLIRIGGFSPGQVDACMEPIVGMEDPFCYRNKAQYPVGTDKNGNVITGFYAGRTHNIIANTDCCLGVPENERILQCVLRYMEENHVTAYDEASGQGLIRHVLIRKGFTSGEIMVCLVINQKVTHTSCMCDKDVRSRVFDSVSGPNSGKEQQYLPAQEKLCRELAKIDGMTSVSVNFNPEGNNVIMGKEIRTIWGNPTISDTIHVRDMGRKGYPFTGQELTFHISPLSFYQINPVQTEKLYSLALEYAGLTGQETLWDLYCGIGTISLFLARDAKKVYGVEVIPQAIYDARRNAEENGISNAEFIVGKAEVVLPAFYEHGVSEKDFREASAEAMRHPDVIVVDPPRKGCGEACLSTILKMKPERVVYVSCDPATLARDLAVLCDGGYELRRVRGVDQFPQTVHVECVVEIQRKHM
ncbi:MAG: 23S rRNA (uracil(1939)-C(5))-methyltransferase RlmD [Acetatifactor sp.]|nr:23S rRNA (uracil(1939)-C(5))-methyltransferase RlmD [Acetatifactor sp.]